MQKVFNSQRGLYFSRTYIFQTGDRDAPVDPRISELRATYPGVTIERVGTTVNKVHLKATALRKTLSKPNKVSSLTKFSIPYITQELQYVNVFSPHFMVEFTF